MGLWLDPTDSPAEGDLTVVGEGLRRYNREAGSYTYSDRFAVFLREGEAGTVRGGAVAFRIGAEAFLDWLWVDESLRGAGHGARLMAAIERAAAGRGCRRITLDTASFQAPEFYRKKGYQVLAEIPDYVGGHARIFFRKLLGGT